MHIKTWTGALHEVKFLEDAPETVGTFSGLCSVYGNVDRDGEVVDRGAFTKTLSEAGRKVPLLWQHDTHEPIGYGIVEDTEAGLKINGRLSLGTTRGREAYALLKDGALDAMSFGYLTVKSRKVAGVVHLSELKLLEVSLVTIPANPLATVSTVKSFGALAELPIDQRAFQLANVLSALSNEIRTGGTLPDAYRDVLRDNLTHLGALLAPAPTAEAAPAAAALAPAGTSTQEAAEPAAEPEADLLHSIRALADLVTAA